MRNADNDNEPLSFMTLQAATRNVVRYLSKEQNDPENEKRRTDDNPGKGKEADPKQNRDYIEHRLREIAAWERRIKRG